MVAHIEEFIIPAMRKIGNEYYYEAKNLFRMLDKFQYLHVTSNRKRYGNEK